MPIIQPAQSKPVLQALTTLWIVLLAAASARAQDARQHDLPLISGAVGFVTSTNGGNTTYIPVLSPLIAAPLGKHLLVESRATLLDAFFPKGAGQPGYKSDSFLGLTYLQANLIACSHVTLVAGEFLTPFGTYNERLSPLWISNFQDAPRIFSIGTMGSASSVGGMVRGSLYSSARLTADYAAYYSANSTNQQFSAERSSGGRGSVYLPAAGVEVGASYGRRLQPSGQNFAGMHFWWEPPATAFRLRSEYAHGPHSSGYWVEADYRLSRFKGKEAFVSGFEPVLRLQQTFRSQPDPADVLPSAATRQLDLGLDYRLPHEVRMNTSFSRQFSSTGNRNIWQTGIVYRFLFPAWRSK